MSTNLRRIAPDLTFILGALAIALGFGTAATGCFGGCTLGFLPLTDLTFMWFLFGVEMIAFSLWFILRREVGKSRMQGEITIIVASALAAMAAYIPLSGHFVLPAYSDAGAYGILYLVLIFESVVLAWVVAFRLVHKKTRKTYGLLSSSQPRSRGPGGRTLVAGMVAPAIFLIIFFYPISCGFAGCSFVGNVQTITLDSASCQSSSIAGACQFALNNPRSPTILSLVQLVETPQANAVTASVASSFTQNIQLNYTIAGNSITNATVQFPSNVPFNTTVTYMLEFTNGESISGLLVSQ